MMDAAIDAHSDVRADVLFQGKVYCLKFSVCLLLKYGYVLSEVCFSKHLLSLAQFEVVD